MDTATNHSEKRRADQGNLAPSTNDSTHTSHKAINDDRRDMQSTSAQKHRTTPYTMIVSFLFYPKNKPRHIIWPQVYSASNARPTQPVTLITSNRCPTPTSMSIWSPLQRTQSVEGGTKRWGEQAGKEPEGKQSQRTYKPFAIPEDHSCVDGWIPALQYPLSRQQCSRIHPSIHPSIHCQTSPQLGVNLVETLD